MQYILLTNARCYGNIITCFISNRNVTREKHIFLSSRLSARIIDDNVDICYYLNRCLVNNMRVIHILVPLILE